MSPDVNEFTVENLAVPGTEPVSFGLAPGRSVGVAGPSGIGKTRLMRALADLEPHAGAVRLDGVEQSRWRPSEWRRTVVYLPSDSAWWHPRVADHFTDWPPPNLEALGLGAGLGERFVDRLSSGERQRLAVLRALALNPRVLLLDEPTANLDDENAAAVEALVACVRRESGLMVVWVTHGQGQRGRVAETTITVRAA